MTISHDIVSALKRPGSVVWWVALLLCLWRGQVRARRLVICCCVWESGINERLSHFCVTTSGVTPTAFSPPAAQCRRRHTRSIRLLNARSTSRRPTQGQVDSFREALLCPLAVERRHARLLCRSGCDRALRPWSLHTGRLRRPP